MIPTFLSLPRELRDQIILPLLYLDKHHSPPKQPPITAACHQLRSEFLPTFYGINQIRLQLDSRNWLSTAQAWLRAIGDVNVGYLRTVEMLGWRRIPFGHMIRRLKVVVVLDLRAGALDGSGGEEALDDACMGWLRERAREGKREGWDAETLGTVMEEFWLACAGDF